MNGNYQYSIVERMSFLRYGGTPEERKAAELLMHEIELLGGKGEYQEFPVPAYEVEKSLVKVVAPFEMEIEAAPCGRSGSFPEGGVDLKFMYAGRGTAEDYYGCGDLSDTIVLINELNIDTYIQLCKHNAGAFLYIAGKHFNNSENSDLTPRMLRDPWLAHGKVPGFMIWAKDATELVRNHAEKLHIELVQREFENISQNVIANIEGTEIPNESIVVTAHYDSVLVGTGAWDNATGSATIMYIYKHFLANKPRRSIRFVWCGSEEQGLLGAKAYVDGHEDLIKNEIKFCFNFDMCGTVLGPNMVFVTGDTDLKHFAEQHCREVGMCADLRVTVHSSDSAPFADKGIPGLGLSRGSKTAEIHTRHDVMFPLSAEQLQKDGDFAKDFIAKVANSARLPVGTGMPQSMKESIDKYFLRDKAPKK